MDDAAPIEKDALVAVVLRQVLNAATLFSDGSATVRKIIFMNANMVHSFPFAVDVDE